MSDLSATISVDAVSKVFVSSRREPVKAIESVSLEARRGEFISIVGHSGCGKTTLLKMIAGLTAPSGGRVRVMGGVVDSPVSSVGHVFQRPVLMPWRTVLDNTLLPVELLHRDKRQYVEKAASLLKMVGLAGFERVYPRELSGGMQHRASLARALIHDPDILLMDEPFGSLDELTREEMAMELLRITERMRKTVLFVTHSVSEAVMLGDRVVILSPRPSTVLKDLRIEIPRPRGQATRADARYIAYCEQVRSLLGLAPAQPAGQPSAAP